MAVTVMHGDIEIAYDESDDVWRFTLRGRDRSAPSLAKARQFIDKPLPPEKAKPFEKIPCWFFRYSEAPKKIEVTGVAEGCSYGGDEKVWINYNGSRSKESIRYAIYPQSPKNDKLVEEILEDQKTIRLLRNKVAERQRKLTPLVIPKDE